MLFFFLSFFFFGPDKINFSSLFNSEVSHKAMSSLTLFPSISVALMEGHKHYKGGKAPVV